MAIKYALVDTTDNIVRDVFDEKIETTSNYVHIEFDEELVDVVISSTLYIDGVFTLIDNTPVFDWQTNRERSYPPMADYLDGIVKNDTAQVDKYIADCKAVKIKYPKE